MNNIIKNWKTTGAGASAIIFAVIHLIFAAIHGKADESAWTVAVTAIFGGIGLIAAGDSDKSAGVDDVQRLKGNIVKALDKGGFDTSSITNLDAPVNPPKK